MFHWVAGKRKWGKEVRQWLGRVTLSEAGEVLSIQEPQGRGFIPTSPNRRLEVELEVHLPRLVQNPEVW